MKEEFIILGVVVIMIVLSYKFRLYKACGNCLHFNTIRVGGKDQKVCTRTYCKKEGSDYGCKHWKG